jgi:bacterioferritin (cytochrome b1)
VLDRLLQLGGMPEYVQIEAKAAYQSMQRMLSDLHTLCTAVYDAAADVDDYVTIKLLQESQESLEKQQTKTENKLDKIERLGEVPFLTENM